MDMRSTGRIDPEDIGSNPDRALDRRADRRRLGRRDALRGLPPPARRPPSRRLPAHASRTGPSTLTFKELAHGMDETQHVPEGYEAQVLIRWGDPVAAGAPAFDPSNQRRRPGEAVRLQLRLHRPASAAGRQHEQRPLPAWWSTTNTPTPT